MEDIEEKARRYDEALKKAVIAHKDEDRHLKATLERIFPELTKSKDEMIRKTLMDFLVGKRIISNDLEGINIDKTLAWLERQGEKPVCSEEDEKMIRALMSICDEWATRHSCLPEENTDIEKIKNWLQSLKFNITDKELDEARKDAFNDALDKIEYHGGKPTFGDGWSAAIWYLKKRLGI